MSEKNKQKILVVSRNPRLAEIRKTVLEGAGFTVISATDDTAVEPACSNGIEVIMVGYSVKPSNKRRVWAKSRECSSNVPIMELHQDGNHELVERNVYAHESNRALHFLKVVQKLPWRKEESRLTYASRSNAGTRLIASSKSIIEGLRTAERKILHTWKEISNYTGLGIRTIQRYEIKFGFPIRRPAGKSRSAVVAFSDEIDAWLSRAPQRNTSVPGTAASVK